jgi:hypothetical protein
MLVCLSRFVGARNDKPIAEPSQQGLGEMRYVSARTAVRFVVTVLSKHVLTVRDCFQTCPRL